jgi:hypothetical protein
VPEPLLFDLDIDLVVADRYAVFSCLLFDEGLLDHLVRDLLIKGGFLLRVQCVKGVGAGLVVIVAGPKTQSVLVICDPDGLAIDRGDGLPVLQDQADCQKRDDKDGQGSYADPNRA